MKTQAQIAKATSANTPAIASEGARLAARRPRFGKRRGSQPAGLKLALGLLLTGTQACSMKPVPWTPCGPSAPCGSGRYCTNEGVCVDFLETCLEDANGDGTRETRCASQAVGASCDNQSEGTLTPCVDDAPFDICNGGCRVCETAPATHKKAWSECQINLCVLGLLHSCDECWQDCATQVIGAETPACVSSVEGDRFYCVDARDACLAGYADDDRNKENGCECADDARVTFYLDDDQDGYGTIQADTGDAAKPATMQLCNALTLESGFNYVAESTDCNDADSTVYPGAPEMCDGQLNDCTQALSLVETDPDGDDYIGCDAFIEPRTTNGFLGGDDCANGPFDEDITPETDHDGDGTPDCEDTCTDADYDRLGSGRFDYSGCVYRAPDSNDNDAAHCTDTDHDGCDDCANGYFEPNDDAVDKDRDGYCVAHSGEATSHTPMDDNACLFGTTINGKDIAEINQSDWYGSAWCGACADVIGPLGTVRVLIEGICMACPSGDLVLNSDAFNKIASSSAERVAITWAFVPCDVTGPVSYHFKDGSNASWTAVQVLNHRLPIKTLEYSVDGGLTWRPTLRMNYNYFVDSAGFGPYPTRVRITAPTGQTLIDTLPPVTTDATIEGQANFD